MSKEFGKLQVFDKVDEGIHLLEEDRRRISNELYDGPMRSLMHVTSCIDLAAHALESDCAHARSELTRINRMIVRVIHDIQQMVYDLRPLPIDQVGFISAVKQLPDKCRHHLTLKVNVANDVTDEIAPARRVALYRFIQDILMLVKEHGKTPHATLTVARSECDLLMTIQYGCKEEKPVRINESDVRFQILKSRATYLNGEFKWSRTSRGYEFSVSAPVYI
jgi:two-component system sensor histidine kinase DegS